MLRSLCQKMFGRSLWVYHANSGGCNGCDIEVLNALTPYYDAERFGIKCGSELIYGACRVNIPVENHRRGELELRGEPYATVRKGAERAELGLGAPQRLFSPRADAHVRARAREGERELVLRVRERYDLERNLDRLKGILACAAGVFSAATHSGSIRSARSFSAVARPSAPRPG